MPKGSGTAALEVAALLVTEDRDRAPVQLGDAGDECGVVGAAAVAVQLEEVVRHPFDVVEGVGPLLVPRSSTALQMSSPLGSARSARAAAADARARRTGASRAGGQGRSTWRVARGVAARLHPAPYSSPKSRSSFPSVGRSSGRGTIASTWPKRRFDSARPKSSGQLLPGRLRDDARAGEGHQRARLGDQHVAEAREAGQQAAGRGVRDDEMSAQPASCGSSTAQTVFGSCISDRMPSCMRAPPDADTETSGTSALGGAVAGACELLADDAAHRAAHEGEVHDGQPARPSLDRGGRR